MVNYLSDIISLIFTNFKACVKDLMFFRKGSFPSNFYSLALLPFNLKWIQRLKKFYVLCGTPKYFWNIQHFLWWIVMPSTTFYQLEIYKWRKVENQFIIIDNIRFFTSSRNVFGRASLERSSYSGLAKTSSEKVQYSKDIVTW